MSAWRDALQRASFRGVPFWVDTDAVPVGRRTQVHEYPQRDEPYVEDLGRRTRKFAMAAFVIGDDCLAQRDALLKALDTAGEGELVHPWLGRLTVTAADCEMSHDRREGGMVRFDLVFVEAGKLEFPSARANSRRQASLAAEGLWSSAQARYKDAMALIDTARINLNTARGALSAVHALIQRQFAPLAGILGDIDALVDAVVNAPDSILGAFASYFGGLVPGGGYTASLTSISSAADTAVALERTAPAGGTDTAGAVRAVADLVQDAALYQAVREAASLEVAPPLAVASPPSLQQQIAQPMTAPEVPIADDVIAVRESLKAVLWASALRAPHDHYQTLAEARLQVDRHLTEVAAAGVRLERMTPLQSMPALVLAYRRFGDAHRASEIITRNRISHPGFLPAMPLQVAAE